MSTTFSSTIVAISYYILIFRYIEANVRRSSKYRRYNENLPVWLHNRPKKFVDHCVEKLGLAKRMPYANIKEVAYKQYTVRASSNSDTYLVFSAYVTVGNDLCFLANIYYRYLNTVKK